MTPRPERLSDAVTLYEGDCLDVLPTLTGVDAVVTDPPYGVGFEYDSYVDDEQNWSNVKAVVFDLISKYPTALCMSFHRLFEMPSPKWQLAWHKPGSVRRSKINGWSTWEPVLLYGKGWSFSQDLIRLPDCQNHSDGNKHPCPKPVNLFRWIIGGNDFETILDPFAGSGTTGVAAILEGRRAILIEKDPHYCDIIRRRIADAEATGPQSLFRNVRRPELFDGVEVEQCVP